MEMGRVKEGVERRPRETQTFGRGGGGWHFLFGWVFLSGTWLVFILKKKKKSMNFCRQLSVLLFCADLPPQLCVTTRQWCFTSWFCWLNNLSVHSNTLLAKSPGAIAVTTVASSSDFDWSRCRSWSRTRTPAVTPCGSGSRQLTLVG